MTDQKPRAFRPDDSVGYRHEVVPPFRPAYWKVEPHGARRLSKKEAEKVARAARRLRPNVRTVAYDEHHKMECRYLERWILGVGIPGRKALFSVRLHHFFRSDEDHLHDHPTWFWTLVLRGSYEDWVACSHCGGTVQHDCHDGQVVGTQMTPGKIRFRSAHHLHRVVTDGCWTLCLFGPKKRDWGFMVGSQWLRQRAYFKKYGGSAACE